MEDRPNQEMLLRLSERRRTPRIMLEENVVFRQSQNQHFSGVVKDLSETGAYLVSSETFLPHTILTILIAFGFGRRKKLHSFKGRVIRIESKESSVLRGYALRFE